MAKKKAARTKAVKKSAAGKRSAGASTAKASSTPSRSTAHDNGAARDANAPVPPRLLPLGAELKSLYERYTGGTKFDEHDKAFYFVLDVGGVSRARQLVAHVEEVLAELEEFH